MDERFLSHQHYTYISVGTQTDGESVSVAVVAKVCAFVIEAGKQSIKFRENVVFFFVVAYQPSTCSSSSSVCR